MRLIVGLGNPGLRYRNTRHNVGVMVLNALAKEYNIKIKKSLYKGLTGEGYIDSEKALLLLPETYMNSSGESVAPAVKEIPSLLNLLVVCDDIDLLLGNIRFRPMGSSGGHKGLKSIIDKLKTEEFPRLKVGINPGKEIDDASDFVLKPFLKEEKRILDRVLIEAVEGIETWITSGIEECMRRYNRRQSIRVLP